MGQSAIPPPRPTEDERTKAALTAYQCSMASGLSWRRAIRDALAAADAVQEGRLTPKPQAPKLPLPPTGTMGFAHQNPETGWEWSQNHPIRSGECIDATAIKWMSLARFQREHPDALPAENRVEPPRDIHHHAMMFE